MPNAQQWAQLLTAWGWAIVPVPHGAKFPTIAWKEFQTRVPTPAEHAEWFRRETGLCVVCGAVSDNLVCLDFDTEGAYERWRDRYFDLACALPTARSARGWHAFLKTPTGIPSGTLFLSGFDGRAGDLIADGKLVVLPPTVHPSGFVREWVVEPTEDVPRLTLAEVGVTTTTTKADQQGPKLLADRVEIGTRHSTLRSLAGKLRAQGHQFGFIRDMLLCVNDARCEVPLPSEEVARLAEWAAALPETSSSPRGAVWEDETSALSSSHSLSLREEDAFGGWFVSCPVYLAEAGAVSHSWVVEGFLPETYLAVLGGNSKSGKSCIATGLSMAVCQGETFLGMPTRQAPVLWCALEESEAERADVLRQFPNQPDNLFITHRKMMMDTQEGLAALRYWVRKTGAKLVVIDPLYGSSSADTLSDGRKARESLSGLKELCRTERICVLLLHHFTKNVGAGLTRERFADSNQILATASMDVLMESTEKPDKTREIRLVGRGRGQFANQTWLVRSSCVADYQLVTSGASVQLESALREDDILKVLQEVIPEFMTAEDIAHKTGQNVKTVQNTLTALRKQGKVTVNGKRGNANLYLA